MTNCGASLMFSNNCSGSLINRARFTEAIRDGVLFVSLSRVLFPRGVLLDGVLSCFDGVREAVAPFPLAFLGVEEGLLGVGGAGLFFDVVLPTDFSRNVYSFLYTRGGQGGWPSRGGSFNVRASLRPSQSALFMMDRVAILHTFDKQSRRKHEVLQSPPPASSSTRNYETAQIRTAQGRAAQGAFHFREWATV